MLGRREIEATDSKYPFPLMPIMHGSDFSCYFLLFFFFFPASVSISSTLGGDGR